VLIASYTVSGITWTRIGVEGGGLVLEVEDGELLIVMIRLDASPPHKRRLEVGDKGKLTGAGRVERSRAQTKR